MSVDLTDRLSAMFVGLVNHVDRSLFGEARDEIVRLREENERLKQAAVAFESRCNQHRLFAEAAGAERDRMREWISEARKWCQDGLCGDAGANYCLERIHEAAGDILGAALGDKP